MKESVLQQEAVRSVRPDRSPVLRSSRPAVAEAPPVSLIRRLRWPLLLLVAGGVAWGFKAFRGTSSAPAPKAPPVRMVTIQTPPPAPPPLPPPPPPRAVPEQPKVIEQAPVNEEEPKPDEPKPADDSPPALGTGIKGDGPPDGFGLSGKAGAGGNGGLKGSGGARSRWGWYAAKVQSGISDALRRDPKLRDAVLNGRVRIWPDATGRISQARLDGSTGDPALDAAVNRALTGLQLPEPPPADMPAPILLRVTARRP